MEVILTVFLILYHCDLADLLLSLSSLDEMLAVFPQTTALSPQYQDVLSPSSALWLRI